MRNPASQLTALLSLASLSHAYTLYFYVSPLVASDLVGPTCHTVNFTVSAPNNFPEQGGNAAVTCNLAWSEDAIPTCWTGCGAPVVGNERSYNARITPGSYRSAADFSVDVVQTYVYELVNHNLATIPISVADTTTPGAGYDCSPGSGRTQTVCMTQSGVGFNQTFTTDTGEIPVGTEYCPGYD